MPGQPLGKMQRRLTSKFRFAPATPPDAPALAEILHESFAEFEPLYTQEAFAATTPNAAQILTRMREGPVWIAAREAQVRRDRSRGAEGRVGLCARDGGLCPGEGIRSWRSIAYAGRALGFGPRCGRILPGTTPFLLAAIALYDRVWVTAGFHERPHELFGTPLFTMEKHILQ